MIAKGTTHNNGAKLAQYMITGKPGERAELWQLRGFEATDIKDAFRDVQIMAEGTKCEQPFFHVQVRNPNGEELTRDQWERIANRIESKLGLSGQPRAIAFHIEEESGHEHMHLAWSRIDEDTLTAKHMPFFKERLKEVSRELEIKFGLTRVPNDREGPIKYAPTKAEQEQARRLGVDIHEIRNAIRECYDRSDCGTSFRAALEQEGLTLARGDMRDFVVIDHAGGMHVLSKRILDVPAAKIRAHLSDLTRDGLPSVEQVRSNIPGYERKEDKLKNELAEVQKQIETERNTAIGPEKLDETIYAALLDHAIRNPHLTDQLQILAWKMPTEFAIDFGETLAAAREIQARKLELPDIDRLITERETHAYKCELAATDRLILDGKKAPALAYLKVAQEQRDHESEVARLDDIIYPALLQQAIRNPHLTDQVQILAWKMPAEFAIDFGETLAAAQEIQARKLELPDIDRLIAAANRDDQNRQLEETDRSIADLKREIAEVDKLLADTTARQQQQEKPAPVWDRDSDNNAWHDAVIQAAIEKEKAERQFVEPRKRETPGGSRKKETQAEQERRQKRPAPELGKTQGEIRLARSLSHGPQGFANALEDRTFILARVTADDIRREMEQLRKEWEERRRNPQTWMEHEGGFAVLNPELQASARRSFDEWEKQRDKDKGKEQDKKYTVEDYVDYVQKKWLEGPKSQLERATGQLAVITPFGSIYTLTSRNTGLDRDELPHYLKGIDRAALLSVTDAQEVMRDVREYRREEWLARLPLGRTAAEIRLAYSLTQTGQEFANALKDRGFIVACMNETDAERLNRWERQRLKEEWTAPAPEKTRKAKGDQRGAEEKYRAGELVAVNQYGQVFQFTNSNTGRDIDARAERLKDIDRAALLSVTAAQGVMKKSQQHRQEERQKEWQQKREESLQPAREQHWPILPPQPERKSWTDFEKAASESARDDRTENLHGAAAHVWTAFRQSGNEEAFKAVLEGNELYSVRTGNRKAFAAALDDKGIAFAAVSKQEAERSNREAQFARAAGNYAPRFKEGEIVIVTEPRPEFRRDGQIIEPRRVHKLDQSLAEKYVKLLDNRSQLKGIDATLKASDERAKQRAADGQEIRLARATDIQRGGRTRSRNTKDNLAKSPAAILTPVSMGLNVIGKPLKILENIFEGIFAPKLTPEQIRAGKIAARERQADASDQLEHSNIIAQRAQEWQQEEQREAARQREREREGDGRER